MRGHKRDVHIGEKNISCDECGKNFTNPTSLNLHMRIHTGEKLYKCMYCEKRFAFSTNISAHMKVNHGDPADRVKVSCTECRKEFIDKDSFKDHFRLKHSGEKKYKCKECDSAFGRPDYLQSHMYSYHGVVKPLICEKCEYRCWRRRTLSNHERRHTKVKPFLCSRCSKSFGEKGNLIVHEKRIHETIRPLTFECEMCQKICKNQNALSQHIKVCGKPKLKETFQCDRRSHADT